MNARSAPNASFGERGSTRDPYVMIFEERSIKGHGYLGPEQLKKFSALLLFILLQLSLI